MAKSYWWAFISALTCIICLVLLGINGVAMHFIMQTAPTVDEKIMDKETIKVVYAAMGFVIGMLSLMAVYYGIYTILYIRNPPEFVRIDRNKNWFSPGNARLN